MNTDGTYIKGGDPLTFVPSPLDMDYGAVQLPGSDWQFSIYNSYMILYSNEVNLDAYLKANLFSEDYFV